jgi:predicted nucleic acid-binding protein
MGWGPSGRRVRTGLDTNVISALWSADPLARQAEGLLVRARREGGLVICGPVYAELAAHPIARGEFVDQFLSETNITVDFSLDERVWRETARAFAEYASQRRESGGGQPKRLLADFIIGAHSMLHADRLMTLDSERYVSSFPQLRLFDVNTGTFPQR